MSLYSRFILAPLIACACGCKPIRDRRAKIVPRAKGVVLELGAGSGHNLSFYDPSAVSKVIALEPEPALSERIRKAARTAPVSVEVVEDFAENLTLPSNSVDTILATFVLCTIPDGVAALKAAKRALRPDGRLLFCEHGLSPDPKIANTQAKLEPVWSKLLGGCHLTRPIPKLIENAGFEIETIEAGYMPKSPRFAGYHFLGAARPV